MTEASIIILYEPKLLKYFKKNQKELKIIPKASFIIPIEHDWSILIFLAIHIFISIIQYLQMDKPKFNRIKAVLAEKSVSNRELADKLGVTEGTVSTWCRNYKQPSIETLFEVARYLKVEPGTLLNSVKASDT